jgi:hypothetical protein
MKRLTLVLAILVALLAASAATAATPAKYRNTLNAICRAYTPKIKAAQDTMTRATKSQRANVFATGLRTYLELQIRQNRQIERVAIPKRLTKTMKPALKTLRKLDPHLSSALAHSRAGNLKATRSQMSTVIRISEPLNGQLDAAGLIDCGSNQP